MGVAQTTVGTKRARRANVVEFSVTRKSHDGTYTTESVEVEKTASYKSPMRRKQEDVFVVLREIGYMRVSADGQDVALQRDALELAGCDIIFSDKWTGKDKARPGLDHMLAQLRPGDRVNIWKVDRLGRSTVNSLLFVADLWERKVAFRSLTQDFDTSTPSGRLMMTMLMAFSEFERETIVERVNAGLVAARERGIVGGTRRKLDGATVARAREAYANRPTSPRTGKPMSINELADLFGVNRSTFLRWARPDYFLGNTTDAQRFRERHPDLMTWLHKSDDPHFADSPRRRAKVG